jgi:hypothetical protein
VEPGEEVAEQVKECVASRRALTTVELSSG